VLTQYIARAILTCDPIVAAPTLESLAVAKAIERVVSPKERELNRYLTTIESRKRRLAPLQADLETLREDLARFSAEYHARVGLVILDAERMEREAAEYCLRTKLLRHDPAPNQAEFDDQVRRRFGAEWEQHRQD
jgi:hypothetical protein